MRIKVLRTEEDNGREQGRVRLRSGMSRRERMMREKIRSELLQYLSYKKIERETIRRLHLTATLPLIRDKRIVSHVLLLLFPF